MHRLLSFAAASIFLNLAALVFSAEPEPNKAATSWKPVSLPGAKVGIEMPGAPQAGKTETAESVTVELDNGHTAYFLLRFSKSDAAAARPEETLKSVHEELLAAGKVLEDKAIMLGKYPGRELKMTVKNGGADYAYQHRVCIVDGQMVQVMMVAGPETKATELDRKRFFDSLKLDGAEAKVKAK